MSAGKIAAERERWVQKLEYERSLALGDVRRFLDNIEQQGERATVRIEIEREADLYQQQREIERVIPAGPPSAETSA